MSSGSTTTSYTSYTADAFGAANGVLAVSKQPWGEFFGSPPGTQRIKDYDIRSRSTRILPEAYEGQNEKLSQEAEFLAYTDQNFYTSVVMPFHLVEDANYVTWSKTIYDRQMPTLVPELGVSRILTNRRISKTASFVRRGMSYFFEHGFMETPVGRLNYQNTLKQMALNILEFAKFDVVHTLMTSQAANLRWERKFAVYKNKRLADLFANQIWMWACLQKVPNALQILDSRVTEWMAKYHGEADTWILAAPIQAYMQLVPAERIEYLRAGPAGPQRLQDGPRALTRIMTSQAFFARTYDIDASGSVDVLSSEAQIGEYNEMRDRERDTDYEGYVSKSRHIRIYNETANEWYECRLRWALEACQRFDAQGKLLGPSDAHDSNSDDLKGADEDLFSYVDADTGARQQTRLFGHMEEAYFPAGDKLNLAKTAIAALSREYAKRGSTFESIWAAGQQLVDEIDRAGLPTGDALARFTAALGASGTTPTLGADAMTEIMPGLQSYEGLVAISKTAAGGPYQETAALFVAAIKALVARLRTYFPGSYLLDGRFASPWWSQNNKIAAAETTFFENAVARARIPLFNLTRQVSTVADAEGRTGASIASDATYARVYREQRAAAEKRRTAAGAVAEPAVLLPAAIGAAWTPAQKRTAISAATLLAGVGTSKASAEQTKMLYTTVAQRIAERVGATAGQAQPAAAGAGGGEEEPAAAPATTVYDFGRTDVTAEALERDVLALKTPFGSTGDAIKTRLAAVAGQLVPDSTKQARNINYGEAYQGAGRTTLLAGPQLVRDLARAAAVDGNVNLPFVPASPNNPGSPMTYGELQRLGREWQDEASDVSEAMVDADAPASDSIPAFEGAIASELSLFTQHMPITLHSGARLGADMDYGDGALGADFDDVVGGRSGRGRAPARDDAAAEAETAPMRRAWRNVRLAAGGNRLLAAVAHVYDFTPVHKLAFVRWIDNNIIVPIAFIIARPHAEYTMLSGIKCLAGERMGSYLHQPGKFELGDDVEVQSHTGTYTYKSKAFVKEENHVFVARNIFAAGCRGGLGVRLFDPRTYSPNGVHTGQDSIFVLAVPYASGEADGAPISLTGQADVNGQPYSIAQRKSLDYIGVSYYNKLWGWRDVLQADEAGGYGALDQVSDNRNKNTLCFRGQTFFYYRADGTFKVVQLGSGHWGRYVYLGCNAARNGEHVAFERPSLANYIEA